MSTNRDEFHTLLPFEEVSALLASRLRELDRSEPTSPTSISPTSTSTSNSKDTSHPLREQSTATLLNVTQPLTSDSSSLPITRSHPSRTHGIVIGPKDSDSPTRLEVHPGVGSQSHADKLSTRNHTAFEILTYTGKYINPVDPDIKQINVHDIAHALSNICRFGGHCPVFYSVAEHSVLVHDLVKGHMGSTSNIQLAALMHDAEEAYLLDIPTPIKRQFPQYKEAGERMGRAIARRFGFEDYTTNTLIKQSDEQAYYMERVRLWRLGTKPALTPKEAENLFLEVFYEYR